MPLTATTVDYNSWIESDKGLRLAAGLDKDTILAEGTVPLLPTGGFLAYWSMTGYEEYDTGRTYLVKLGDWRNNKDEEVELDGIGGVNILVKADVHRSGTRYSPSDTAHISSTYTNLISGINFPCYAFENQAETEGFAKMAKRAGYQVVGLPNYVVWHIDTDEKPGNLKSRPAY